MTKEQAEQLIRSVLSQINLPLQKHQELQAAVDILKGPALLKDSEKVLKVPDIAKEEKK